jgi:uncharacterized membrane protein YcaP (DUF421 family)
METVLKTTIVYFILWGVLRLSGRRTLAKMTSFDFVVMLIIGGATQRSLLGQDYSVTNGLLVVVTLVVIDVSLSLLQRDFPPLSKVFNGEPMIVVEEGEPLKGRLAKARLSTEQVLEAARHSHGLERMEQIKFAVLEAGGDISIIPYPRGEAVPARSV